MQRVDESDEGSATARDGRRAGAAPSRRTVRWTKPSEMAGPCGGWLAADGRYWPCPDLKHATTAVEIVDALHLVPKGDAMAHLGGPRLAPRLRQWQRDVHQPEVPTARGGSAWVRSTVAYVLKYAAV